MTMLSKLNSIATRIAVAIVLAIILGLVTLMGLSQGLNYFNYGWGREANGGRTHVVASRYNFAIINPQRNAMMLSGRIVVVIRSVASAPQSERQKIVAAIADPEMQIVHGGLPRADAIRKADGICGPASPADRNAAGIVFATGPAQSLELVGRQRTPSIRPRRPRSGCDRGNLAG
jgi:hypothetical protein